MTPISVCGEHVCYNYLVADITFVYCVIIRLIKRVIKRSDYTPDLSVNESIYVH